MPYYYVSTQPDLQLPDIRVTFPAFDTQVPATKQQIDISSNSIIRYTPVYEKQALPTASHQHFDRILNKIKNFKRKLKNHRRKYHTTPLYSSVPVEPLPITPIAVPAYDYFPVGPDYIHQYLQISHKYEKQSCIYLKISDDSFMKIQCYPILPHNDNVESNSNSFANEIFDNPDVANVYHTLVPNPAEPVSSHHQSSFYHVDFSATTSYGNFFYSKRPLMSQTQESSHHTSYHHSIPPPPVMSSTGKYSKLIRPSKLTSEKIKLPTTTSLRLPMPPPSTNKINANFFDTAMSNTSNVSHRFDSVFPVVDSNGGMTDSNSPTRISLLNHAIAPLDIEPTQTSDMNKIFFHPEDSVVVEASITAYSSTTSEQNIIPPVFHPEFNTISELGFTSIYDRNENNMVSTLKNTDTLQSTSTVLEFTAQPNIYDKSIYETTLKPSGILVDSNSVRTTQITYSENVQNSNSFDTQEKSETTILSPTDLPSEITDTEDRIYIPYATTKSSSSYETTSQIYSLTEPSVIPTSTAANVITEIDHVTHITSNDLNIYSYSTDQPSEHNSLISIISEHESIVTTPLFHPVNSDLKQLVEKTTETPGSATAEMSPTNNITTTLNALVNSIKIAPDLGMLHPLATENYLVSATEVASDLNQVTTTADNGIVSTTGKSRDTDLRELVTTENELVSATEATFDLQKVETPTTKFYPTNEIYPTNDLRTPTTTMENYISTTEEISPDKDLRLVVTYTESSVSVSGIPSDNDPRPLAATTTVENGLLFTTGKTPLDSDLRQLITTPENGPISTTEISPDNDPRQLATITTTENVLLFTSGKPPPDSDLRELIRNTENGPMSTTEITPDNDPRQRSTRATTENGLLFTTGEIPLDNDLRQLITTTENGPISGNEISPDNDPRPLAATATAEYGLLFTTVKPPPDSDLRQLITTTENGPMSTEITPDNDSRQLATRTTTESGLLFTTGEISPDGDLRQLITTTENGQIPTTEISPDIDPGQLASITTTENVLLFTSGKPPPDSDLRQLITTTDNGPISTTEISPDNNPRKLASITTTENVLLFTTGKPPPDSDLRQLITTNDNGPISTTEISPDNDPRQQTRITLIRNGLLSVTEENPPESDLRQPITTTDNGPISTTEVTPDNDPRQLATTYMTENGLLFTTEGISPDSYFRQLITTTENGPMSRTTDDDSRKLGTTTTENYLLSTTEKISPDSDLRQLLTTSTENDHMSTTEISPHTDQKPTTTESIFVTAIDIALDLKQIETSTYVNTHVTKSVVTSDPKQLESNTNNKSYLYSTNEEISADERQQTASTTGYGILSFTEITSDNGVEYLETTTKYELESTTDNSITSQDPIYNELRLLPDNEQAHSSGISEQLEDDREYTTPFPATTENSITTDIIPIYNEYVAHKTTDDSITWFTSEIEDTSSSDVLRSYSLVRDVTNDSLPTNKPEFISTPRTGRKDINSVSDLYLPQKTTEKIFKSIEDNEIVPQPDRKKVFHDIENNLMKTTTAENSETQSHKDKAKINKQCILSLSSEDIKQNISRKISLPTDGDNIVKVLEKNGDKWEVQYYKVNEKNTSLNSEDIDLPRRSDVLISDYDGYDSLDSEGEQYEYDVHTKNSSEIEDLGKLSELINQRKLLTNNLLQQTNQINNSRYEMEIPNEPIRRKRHLFTPDKMENVITITAHAGKQIESDLNNEDYNKRLVEYAVKLKNKKSSENIPTPTNLSSKKLIKPNQKQNKRINKKYHRVKRNVQDTSENIIDNSVHIYNNDTMIKNNTSIKDLLQPLSQNTNKSTISTFNLRNNSEDELLNHIDLSSYDSNVTSDSSTMVKHVFPKINHKSFNSSVFNFKSDKILAMTELNSSVLEDSNDVIESAYIYLHSNKSAGMDKTTTFNLIPENFPVKTQLDDGHILKTPNKTGMTADVKVKYRNLIERIKNVTLSNRADKMRNISSQTSNNRDQYNSDYLNSGDYSNFINKTKPTIIRLSDSIDYKKIVQNHINLIKNITASLGTQNSSISDVTQLESPNKHVTNDTYELKLLVGKSVNRVPDGLHVPMFLEILFLFQIVLLIVLLMFFAFLHYADLRLNKRRFDTQVTYLNNSFESVRIINDLP